MKSRLLLFAIHCLFFLNVTYAVEKNTFDENEKTIIGNSTNNDKYWYNGYLQGKMDGNGKPIDDAYKKNYPENDCLFEIQFSYLENPNQISPVLIYLNEVKSEKTLKSELIGAINKNLKSSVEFKSDGVDIFTVDKHIHVHADGKIVMFDIKNGTYANGTFRIFKAPEAASVIYKVRYQVLVEKLKKIFVN